MKIPSSLKLMAWNTLGEFKISLVIHSEELLWILFEPLQKNLTLETNRSSSSLLNTLLRSLGEIQPTNKNKLS